MLQADHIFTKSSNIFLPRIWNFFLKLYQTAHSSVVCQWVYLRNWSHIRFHWKLFFLSADFRRRLDTVHSYWKQCRKIAGWEQCLMGFPHGVQIVPTHPSLSMHNNVQLLTERENSIKLSENMKPILDDWMDSARITRDRCSHRLDAAMTHDVGLVSWDATWTRCKDCLLIRNFW